MKLGERLDAIARQAAGQGAMADIGTDHAQLPVYLLEQKLIPYAIAVEVNEGPYRAARDMIERAGMKDRIDLRFGSGLQPLKPGEVSTIVMAGMGGSTMIEILEDRPDVTAAVKRLILQPMTAAGMLRRWLSEQGWRIAEEELVEEEGRLYEVLAAEPGASEHVEEILYEIGPLLWQKKPPLLLKHMEQLLLQTERILTEMGQSERAAQTGKYQLLLRKRKALEEKRECLLTAE